MELGRRAGPRWSVLRGQVGSLYSATCTIELCAHLREKERGVIALLMAFLLETGKFGDMAQSFGMLTMS